VKSWQLERLGLKALDDRKEAVRRLFESAYNQQDFAAADELLDEGLELHTPFQPDEEPLHGRQGFKRMVTWVHDVWPDGTVELENLLAEGDRVALRLRFEGTHGGPLHAYPATGRPAKRMELVICEFANGKIDRIWHETNMVHVLQQVGALPNEWEMGRPPRAIVAVLRARGKLKRRLAARRAART
jgi:predicted ester cyclase